MANKDRHDICGFIIFLILFPLVSYIWYKNVQNPLFATLVLLMPIVVSYIIPAIGTNVVKLWKFNARAKIGNFTFYHGIMLGTLINMFNAIMYAISPNYKGVWEAILFGLVAGTLVAFWFLLIDIQALKDGFLEIYNKPAYEKKSPYEIIADYAIIYFFTFGAIHAFYIKLMQYCLIHPEKNFYFLSVFAYIAVLILPCAICCCVSKFKHGTWGIYPYKPDDNK